MKGRVAIVVLGFVLAGCVPSGSGDSDYELAVDACDSVVASTEDIADPDALFAHFNYAAFLTEGHPDSELALWGSRLGILADDWDAGRPVDWEIVTGTAAVFLERCSIVLGP